MQTPKRNVLSILSSLDLDREQEEEEDDEDDEDDEEDKEFDLINLKRARIIEKRLFSNWPTSLGVEINREFRETLKIENYQPTSSSSSSSCSSSSSSASDPSSSDDPTSFHLNKYNLYSDNVSTFYYTEIHPRSFLKLLESLKNYNIHLPQNSVFLDGTCGLGKTLIIATISNLFTQVYGVEISLNLIKLSKDLIKKFHNNFRKPVDAALINVIHSDIIAYRDLRHINVMYLFLTFFNSSLIEKLEYNLLTLRPGSALLLAGNRLSNRNTYISSYISLKYSKKPSLKYMNMEEYFDLVTTFRILYAGGIMVPIFLYRRNNKQLEDDPLLLSKDSVEFKQRLPDFLNKSYGI